MKKTIISSSKEFTQVCKLAKYEFTEIQKSIFVCENHLNKAAKGTAEYSGMSNENIKLVAYKVQSMHNNKGKYFDICVFPKNSKGVSCVVKHSKSMPKWGYDIVDVSDKGFDYLVPISTTDKAVFAAFCAIAKVDIKETEKAAKVATKIAKEKEKAEKAYNKAYKAVFTLFGDITNIMTKEQIIEKYNIIKKTK